MWGIYEGVKAEWESYWYDETNWGILENKAEERVSFRNNLTAILDDFGLEILKVVQLARNTGQAREERWPFSKRQGIILLPVTTTYPAREIKYEIDDLGNINLCRFTGRFREDIYSFPYAVVDIRFRRNSISQVELKVNNTRRDSFKNKYVLYNLFSKELRSLLNRFIVGSYHTGAEAYSYNWWMQVRLTTKDPVEILIQSEIFNRYLNTKFVQDLSKGRLVRKLSKGDIAYIREVNNGVSESESESVEFFIDFLMGILRLISKNDKKVRAKEVVKDPSDKRSVGVRFLRLIHKMNDLELRFFK